MNDVEKKIIAATLECIEEFGIQDVTIRKIGEKAKVNSAAVSYYFRGKENLVDAALKASLEKAFRWEAYAYTLNWPLRDQLIEIFGHLAVETMKFPRVAGAHLYDVFIHQKTEGFAVSLINQFLVNVEKEVRRKQPAFAPLDARIGLTAIASAAIVHLPAFTHLFDAYSGLNMGDPHVRQQYVTRLIDRFFPEEY